MKQKPIAPAARKRQSMLTPAIIRNEMIDIADQLIASHYPPATNRQRLITNARKQFASLLRDIAR